MNTDPLRAAEAALAKLLTESFNIAELRRWLRMNVQGWDVNAEIPKTTGLSELADEVVAALGRRRMLNHEFFQHLEEERPNRRDEIQRLRADFELALRPSVFKTSDLTEKPKTFGNADRFQLLFKVASHQFVRSTKAMQVTGGCIIQVSTREIAPGGGLAVAEAVTFVPDVRIVEEFNDAGEVVGRHLEPLTREAE